MHYSDPKAIRNRDLIFKLHNREVTVTDYGNALAHMVIIVFTIFSCRGGGNISTLGRNQLGFGRKFLHFYE